MKVPEQADRLDNQIAVTLRKIRASQHELPAPATTDRIINELLAERAELDDAIDTLRSEIRGCGNAALSYPMPVRKLVSMLELLTRLRELIDPPQALPEVDVLPMD